MQCPRGDGYRQREIASTRVKSQLFLSLSPSAILIPSPSRGEGLVRSFASLRMTGEAWTPPLRRGSRGGGGAAAYAAGYMCQKGDGPQSGMEPVPRFCYTSLP